MVSTTTTPTVNSFAAKHKVSALIVVGTLAAVLGLTATTGTTAFAFTLSRPGTQRQRQQQQRQQRRDCQQHRTSRRIQQESAFRQQFLLGSSTSTNKSAPVGTALKAAESKIISHFGRCKHRLFSSSELNANADGDSGNGDGGSSINGSEDSQELHEETAFEAAESMVQIDLSNERTKDLLLLGDLMPEDDFSRVVPSIPDGADADGFELAPPMTYQKYVTMNTKCVPVQIRYTANSGLRPYFLTVARRLKADYPDVLIERTLLTKSDSGGGGISGGSSSGATDSESGLFEVVIDGRAVVRLSSGRKGVAGTDGGMTIFVSMEEVDQAIGRARRRRRPSTVYGEENETNVRLEVLKNKAAESLNSKQ